MNEQEEEKRIAKLFNAGYQMQKHEPELLNKILKTDSKDSEYIKALELGKQQAQRDRIIEQQNRIKENKVQKTKKR